MTEERAHGRVTFWLLAFVVLIAAVGVLLAGPTTKVVCGEGHGLDRIAQSVGRGTGGGHIDGPTASYCVVPDDLTWIAAGAGSSAG